MPGPLLCLIYINDIVIEVERDSSAFANDTSLIKPWKDDYDTVTVNNELIQFLKG